MQAKLRAIEARARGGQDEYVRSRNGSSPHMSKRA